MAIRFPNETIVLDDAGNALSCYNKDDFIAETLVYRHNKTLRDLLTGQWLTQKTPAEAIAYVREKAGARTREELDAAKRPVGRPRVVLTTAEFQSKVALAVVKVICDVELRDMSAETRAIVAGVKRQALQQLGGP